ncbi:coiled-coil and C2 domain-containing protein 1B isoform X1 [Astyanax mexicanus]|uniref:coiled-coil and C2 domain-containing protein 1B isoform X1 n=1 Tax=Astyanax mexicanus TaxID=7994 RepID=UPI0020CACA42|nr:coiled-coil and C2 domain-containing protein 1B isoform X1 [Astyanax mexicanus]XP_022524021.2 coiled-coil and C2 domain-containing protein 1B isoform X1 [Astyanax mexicanus]XP_022524022.2 coiled-coil and C2 domain-containing protein 1B isoform X1 [Astyanax mexicanus]XP_049334872.1 coiled-coil and C2 domain-containing protein 1B isoform X1 [Astyanax mexicanus]XP_049334873.1 coiled-coil and C2 domain-containing protein 1B isoform X1 [Astyanax mexicanus]XP_049334874.1 coiled-coil and C2 domain
MFGRKNKRAAAQKGQGAAAAKQMGLFLDFNPEDMMEMGQDVDDPDLEAEFAAIVGKKPAAKGKKPTKAPLPMEDIEKMTEACMKDIDDEDDDENVEDDEDLLAELQEVVGDEEETEDSGAETQPSPSHEETRSPPPAVQEVRSSAAVAGSVEHTLQERITMYRTAVGHAHAAAESSKARRYERGLKTLQGMLTTVRKGGKINESEIPPPVACGAPSDLAPPPAPLPAPAAGTPSPELESPDRQAESDSAVEISPVSVKASSVSAETSSVSMEPAATSEEEASCSASPEEEEPKGAVPESHTAPAEAPPLGTPTKEMLLDRQREYRMAALKAKQAGEIDQAKMHIKTSKGFDAVIEALEKGQPIDLNSLPPRLSTAVTVVKEAPAVPTVKVSPSPSTEGQAAEAPVSQAGPVQPRSVLEALEQRMAKYKEACAQAKASGDERKSRMHDRIAKQYQSAIRSHKAGRPVNYDELPVPPGFPPIPGQQAAAPEQGLAAVLEAANKLASNEADAGDEDDDDENEAVEKEKKESKQIKATAAESQKKPTVAVSPTVQPPKRTPSASPDQTAKSETLSNTASQQLEFLEGRKKQYMKAALQAKQKNDVEQAKLHLRTAKSFDPMIEAARSGKAVDISKVPSPPGEEDDDFILVDHSDVQISEKSEEVYTQLSKILKEQHEKCMTISKQFTHMGNITETTKFEKMADRCKKSLEILKLAQNRGLEPPKHHFEERTYRTVRIFPELSSTDMVVIIVRGMNLPAPSGVASNDLDAFVKFDFPYPSSDQPQKHKTTVIKNTNSPEYNQSFTLNINRNHRGFRRVVQSKGLKLELFHKGGFLRSDKPIGTALVKLEKLETESEVREIVEVMDGRKASGGRLEVKVRLREPLSGQDLQTVSERWLVLDQSQAVL